ncbi:amidohydrolase [Fusobacterium pseudoperiodonticum]|uniref:amidohydrolase n=1 Tax=Fusobacterium pseudoperiodonticum TaxID=2663009 RepID=UPI000C1B0ADB|nr:amidohydrolase [Fusobacterium pseudoperiodonticum]MDU5803425.1 amidohydrolase [Fusobacterium periodonticum]PIM77715.1 amidohydrolase [Fusobacterium pseudoperiodonticum]
MDIKEKAENIKDYIIEMRRHFHQNPELSLEEFETTKKIVNELEKMGIEVSTFKDGLTGCIGTIKGAKEGKTLLLRADIDALSVHEKTNLEFASRVDGKMHACGHDCHAAMLLGVAKILSEMKDKFSGNIKLFFQAAEEIGLGAKLSIEQGVMDNVDACYGVHVTPRFESPKINMQYGERMAATDVFKLTVEGTSSHGSSPHLGHDAIVASAAIITALQTIVSRINNPLKPAVVTIGTIKGGQRFNIIANEVIMEGNVRTFDEIFRKEIETHIREIAESVAKAHSCTAKLEYRYGTGVVLNKDKNLVDIAQNAVKKLYGEDSLVEMEKITGGEDFSLLMEKAPGIFGYIGTRNPKVPGSEKINHHECFTVDEDALIRGTAVAAQFALDYLN